MPTLTGRPRRALFGGVLVPFLLAACSTNGSPAPTGTAAPTLAPVVTPVPSPTAAPVAVLLEIATEGGFINPSVTLAALPTVVVYADGRIVTPGTPPPGSLDTLITPISVRDVGPTGAAAILAAIQTVGLDKPATGDPGLVADAGMTVFTVTPAAGAPVITRFAASGPGGPGLPGVGGGDNPERAAAFDLLDQLLDTTTTWGATTAPSSTYVPLGYRVFIAPGAPAGDGSTDAPAVAWPLATGPADFGIPAVPDRGVTGLRSGVVVGADARTLATALATATTSTAFTSGGASFTLWVRALLPHELPG